MPEATPDELDPGLRGPVDAHLAPVGRPTGPSHRPAVRADRPPLTFGDAVAGQDHEQGPESEHAGSRRLEGDE